MQDKKKMILSFMKQQKFCVLSTVDGQSKSESATVAFSETEDLDLIFGTFNTYRKYKNLRNNPNVSIVIGFKENSISIQYEGVAQEVIGEEMKECRKIHLAKHPGSKKYAHQKEQTYFKVKPIWVRYTDYSKEPERMFELTI